jgi:hypothetical protein
MFNKITFFQKCILFSILLIKTTAHCADASELEVNYLPIHFDARVQWLWHENQIDQLKDKAEKFSANKILDYSVRGERIAQFDAKQKTVTTFVPGGQKLTLSYEMFDSFLWDADLYDLAEARYFAIVRHFDTHPFQKRRCNCSIV